MVNIFQFGCLSCFFLIVNAVVVDIETGPTTPEEGQSTQELHHVDSFGSQPNPSIDDTQKLI